MTTHFKTPTAAEINAYVRRGEVLRSQCFFDLMRRLVSAVRRLHLLPTPPAKTA